MSGVGGRSGRRTVKPPPADLVLPELDGTEDSVMRFNAAIAVAVAGNRLDPRWADSLLKSSAGHLAAIKQKQNRASEREVKEMLERAEQLVRDGIAREVADRTGAIDGTEKVAVDAQKRADACTGETAEAPRSIKPVH